MLVLTIMCPLLLLLGGVLYVPTAAVSDVCRGGDMVLINLLRRDAYLGPSLPPPYVSPILRHPPVLLGFYGLVARFVWLMHCNVQA